MLRIAGARSAACLEQGSRAALRRQWQSSRLSQPLLRGYADIRTPDQKSGATAGIPQAPILQTATTSPAQAAATDVPPSQIPPLPPSPTEVNANPPPATPKSPPPPPPKKRRRFRNFLFTLILFSALGYGGGVYYSLVNDNFHDFFTEYVPFGEDAVSYFEEREFRKRFGGNLTNGRYWPQTRGENKVTVARQSGVNARVSSDVDSGKGSSSDLGAKGRHLSAVDDNKGSAKPADAKKEASKPAQPAKKESATEKESAVTHKLEPKKESKSESPASKPASPAPAATLVDNQSIAEGQERAVQELVKLVNNFITAVNASPEASQYQNVVSAAKLDLNKVIGEIKILREQTAQEADTKIKNAHTEFDDAAKELVRRLEGEMREQETRWREEYEQEREKLSTSYQQKLSAELDAAKKVSEQKTQSALMEQEIALQKKFMDSVKAKVEEERSGRLSKLDELSSNVAELDKLTSQWNEVVDATLQTQHLQVALESVKAKLKGSEHPTPFINELVALKEVSKDNEVVNAAIASINPIAYQRGIPSSASLIDRFRRVASEVRKASLLPEDAGVASHAASAVLSRFMFQKKSERGLPEGEDVEATLARTEVLLEEGDLDAAAREMNALKGWAGVLSRDWVSECRRVLEVRQAVEVMSTEARLQSLLVD